MTQKIDGFAESYASTKNTSEDLAYYEQKKILAQSFGTAKAQRKLESVLTNRVEEIQTGSKGIHDSRVQKMAKNVSKDAAEVKKQNISTDSKKKAMYNRAALMPDTIFDLIPYKQTH